MIKVKLLLAMTLCPAAAAAATPDYVVIKREITVDRPADIVWKRVGADFCAIREWLKVTCEIVSGAGGVGTVRQIRDSTLEPMVAAGDRSYTYSQIAGAMARFDYHGTLAVQPLDGRRSKIVYTVIYDRSALPSDQVREQQFRAIGERFQTAVDTMKAIAETR